MNWSFWLEWSAVSSDWCYQIGNYLWCLSTCFHFSVRIESAVLSGSNLVEASLLSSKRQVCLSRLPRKTNPRLSSCPLRVDWRTFCPDRCVYATAFWIDNLCLNGSNLANSWRRIGRSLFGQEADIIADVAAGGSYSWKVHLQPICFFEYANYHLIVPHQEFDTPWLSHLDSSPMQRCRWQMCWAVAGDWLSFDGLHGRSCFLAISVSESTTI